jgi:uncharacterized OB-fold protein
MRTGTIYTETVVHLAPAKFAGDVPYQVAIVDLANKERLTARIAGGRVSIGDSVTEIESRDGIPYFQKSDFQKS